MDSKLREALVEAARAARANAYAPYSVYHVGAAALSASGDLFVGCNVENASYGLSVCAERTAVFHMVGEGQTGLAAMAVATREGAVPCGACLQVLAEFAVSPDIPVLLVDEEGTVQGKTLAGLLPEAFSGSELKKT